MLLCFCMQKKQNLLEKDVELTLTQQQKSQKINLKLLKMFAKYYKKVWLYVFITVFAMIASAGLTIVLTICSGNLLSSFSDGFVFSEAIKWGTLVFLIALLKYISTWMCNKFWQKANFSIYILIKNDIMERLNSLDQKCLDRLDALKFLERIDWDANNTINKIFYLINILINLISGLAFLSYTMFLNLWVGIFLFGYVTTFAVIKYFHNSVRQKNRMAIKAYAYKTNTIQVDNIRGMKDLRGVNANDSFISLQEEATRHRWSMNYKNTKIDERFTFGANFIVTLYDFVFVLLCAYLVLNKQLFIAGFMVAYNYKGQILTLASGIASFKDELNGCLLCARWVNQLFDQKVFPLEKFGETKLQEFKGEVEFKDVKFEYQNGLQVLSGVTFKIEPKTIVSIVGESGCGKSTIISLLNKVYTLEEGQGKIFFDGHNINDLTKESIRDNICIVSQTPYMFDMTIAENLRLAKKDATDDEIVEILKKVKLYDFVMRLADKMETKLGENGIKLSDGQRQRLAIARALLKNSKIIVFDEATSALDNQNQSKIKRIIKSLKKDHTVITIAHRLSMVADSDKVLFIKEGKVFAEGTHEDLYNNCEAYKELCLAEFQDENDNQ